MPSDVPTASFAGIRHRDRRGRGIRGPEFLPGPLAPGSVPAKITAPARFDKIALALMREVAGRWTEQLGHVELAVEEVPVLPTHWSDRAVPLSSYVEPHPGHGPRLVLFRRPIEHRAETRVELEALLLMVIVEQVAEVLGVDPEQVHPTYDPGEDDS